MGRAAGRSKHGVRVTCRVRSRGRFWGVHLRLG